MFNPTQTKNCWAYFSSLLSSPASISRLSPSSSLLSSSSLPTSSLLSPSSSFSRASLSTSSSLFSKSKEQEELEQRLTEEIDWNEGGWGVEEEEKGEKELVDDMKEAEKEYLERKHQFMGVPEVVDYLREIRAQDIVVVDTRKKTEEMDYLVVASGFSHRHVEGIAKTFYTHVKNESRHTPFLEGQGTDWVIVDLGHMLVSFSRQEVRRYYDIESKWLGYKRAQEKKEEEHHDNLLQYRQQPPA